MFDPTIFENLKVVIEGSVYDLDLEGVILVTGRTDRVDLADMSRTYAIRFRLRDGKCCAELSLTAGLPDFAGEKLEWKNASPGCALELCFRLAVQDWEDVCPQIQKQLDAIWSGRPEVHQTLSFSYPHPGNVMTNEIRCEFNRKIDEGHWSDFPDLLNHMVTTLETLEPFHAGGPAWPT
jgi:hypothetical protein